MSDTNALVLSDKDRAIQANGIQVHEIDLDAKHAVVLTFPPGTKPERVKDTIQNMKKLLDDWWANRKPFLVIGLLDGLELQFHKKEANHRDVILEVVETAMKETPR